jgi:hypothetical protein
MFQQGFVELLELHIVQRCQLDTYSGVRLTSIHQLGVYCAATYSSWMLHIALGGVRILGVGSDGSQRILRRTRAIGENSPNLGNERFGIPEL